MKYVIALDVGGTGMKAALIGADGALLHEDRRSTGRERGPETVINAILDFAAELSAEGIRRFGTPPAAAGVALPGIVDAERGIGVFAANLGWADVPFRALLTERLQAQGIQHCPVAVGHDLRTAGLAEGRLGAARDIDRFLFIALGTGIAAAIGIEGRIEPGAGGAAGEIGHVVVRPDGPPCDCGQRGCLERLASASAVTKAWAAASGDPEATAADCAKAVDSGDSRALAVWQAAIDALVDGLLMGLSMLDPRVIVIGGGLAEAGDTLFVPLRETFASRNSRIKFQNRPEIVPAELGDAAGCLGAGLLAWDLLVTPQSPEVSA